jgi:Protein of unknown function (DUF551)
MMSEKVESQPPGEPLRDCNGWFKTDYRLPANMETVLVWNAHDHTVQFAEFRMYSEKRYEFLQGETVLSIHAVTHWQPEPEPPPDEKLRGPLT